jgi:hypothetical protein
MGIKLERRIKMEKMTHQQIMGMSREERNEAVWQNIIALHRLLYDIRPNRKKCPYTVMTAEEFDKMRFHTQMIREIHKVSELIDRRAGLLPAQG